MSAFDVVPLDHIGAEIVGLDPQAMTDDVRRSLYDVWMEYGVLLFREAAPDPETHIRLAKEKKYHRHVSDSIANNYSPAARNLTTSYIYEATKSGQLLLLLLLLGHGCQRCLLERWSSNEYLTF